MNDAAQASNILPMAEAVAAAPTASRPMLFGGSKQAIRTLGLVIVLLSVFVSSGSFMILWWATDIVRTP